MNFPENLTGKWKDKWRKWDGSSATQSALIWVGGICLVLIISWPLDSKVLQFFGITPLFFSLLFGTIGTISYVLGRVGSERHRKRLDEVVNSMSTRYLQEFPNHLAEITRLIQFSLSDFCALVDCADYGSFSDPEGHAEIIQAIEKIHETNKRQEKKITMRMCICGKPQLISRNSEYWDIWDALERGDPNVTWEDLRDKHLTFPKRLVNFCAVNPVGTFKPAACTREEFKDMMQAHHDRVQKRLEDLGVEFKKSPNMPGFFFWMQDRSEAVFSLSHTGPKVQGIAFYTHDNKIIDILDKTWENV